MIENIHNLSENIDNTSNDISNRITDLFTNDVTLEKNLTIGGDLTASSGKFTSSLSFERNAPYFHIIDTATSGGGPSVTASLHVNTERFYILGPSNAICQKTSLIDKSTEFGGDVTVIGNTTIRGGILNIYNTNTQFQNQMQIGSIIAGDTLLDYGHSTSQTTTNLAGILLNCENKTEIAVHDRANKVHSLIAYDNNTITIGRNMGWGEINNVELKNNLQIGGNINMYPRTFSDQNSIIFRSTPLGDGSPNWLSIGMDKTVRFRNEAHINTSSQGVSAETPISFRINNVEKMRITSSGVSQPSDERIKTNIKDVIDNNALQQILSIKPKTYSYIDTKNIGSNVVYGFISQQIKEVIPQAVELVNNIIPNIYNNCIISGSNIIFNDKDLTTIDDLYVGSNIRLIDANSVEYTPNITNITKNTITVNEILNNNSNIAGFSYGTQVNDFHTLKKDYIYTLNVCATQELNKKIETLTTRITDLENIINNK